MDCKFRFICIKKKKVKSNDKIGKKKKRKKKKTDVSKFCIKKKPFKITYIFQCLVT